MSAMKTGKRPGRPRKTKGNAAYQHLRRNGFWPRGASSTDQLDVIIRDQGTLPSHLQALALRLLDLCTIPYRHSVALKSSGAVAFEVLGTPGEPILERIAFELTGMRPIVPESTDRPWLLKTRGTCKPHSDSDKKNIFTLVVCISTTRPYEMAISRRRELYQNERLRADQYRKIKLDSFDYLVFPACMYHKCIALESNKRVILNTLVKAPK